MFSTLLLTLACTGTPDPEPAEGDDPGECSDDADNDRDGLFDCDDQDCAGADACAPVVDTDVDTDSDTDTDSDPDTDTEGPDPGADNDGDGVSPMAGDCDDANAQVSPWALEHWNRVDDDCNGHVDDAILDEAFDGVIVGSSSNRDDYDPSFGIALQAMPDWNGDGVEDLLVASYYVSDIPVGGLHVILGGQAVGSIRAPEKPSFNLLGTPSAPIVAYGFQSPDTNGDGYSDIALRPDATAEIRLFLSSGATTDRTTASYDGRITTSGRYLNAIGGTGDFDADGLDEVVYYETTSTGAQRVGAIRGQSSAAAWSGTTDARSLFTVAAGGAYSIQGFGVGDLDGDGRTELATHSFATSSGALSTVCVFGGDALSGAWTLTDADACVKDEHPRDYLGVGISSAGDIDGDGHGDLLAVASHWASIEGERGAAYLFAGSATHLLPAGSDEYLALVAPANNADSPPHVADVDQDGLSDVFTTSYFITVDPAMTWVFLGEHLSEGGVFLGPTDADRSLAVWNGSVPLTRADGEVVVAVGNSAALYTGAVFIFGDLGGASSP